MRVRVEDPWSDRLRWALGDAGIWVLVPLLLSLVGGFLLFISIFAGEVEGRWEFFAGGFAAFFGVLTALMWPRGFIVALVLIAAGAFGGWVWEQFRDGGSISAVTYVGGGYDGSHWVGHVHNYEERSASVTCRLEALSAEGDVIGTADMTAADVRPNGGRFVQGEIDVSPRAGAAAQAEAITPHRNLRGTCRTGIP